MICMNSCGKINAETDNVKDSIAETTITTEVSSKEKNMFTFRNATKDEENEMRKLQYSGEWIYETGKAGEKEYALFLGKVMARFGRNDSLSEDWECMYSYPIAAEDENGNKYIIEIYHGSGGPSYSLPVENSGVDLALYESAKDELVKYIEDAEPVDYEWESIYADIPARIKYIIKDGKVTVEDEIMDFDDLEF